MDPVEVSRRGDVAQVGDTARQPAEVDVRVQARQVTGAQGVGLLAVAPEALLVGLLDHRRVGDGVGQAHVAPVRHGLGKPEAHVEQRRLRRRHAPRGGRGGRRAGQQVVTGRDVPQSGAGCHPLHPGARVPGGVRDMDLVLVAGEVDQHRGAGSHHGPGGGVPHLRRAAVDGHEQRGG